MAPVLLDDSSDLNEAMSPGGSLLGFGPYLVDLTLPARSEGFLGC